MPWFKAHHKGHEKTLHTLDTSFEPIMHRRLDEITGRDLEQIRTAWLNDGNKPSTANRKMGSIRGVFSRAVEWAYLPASPLEKVVTEWTYIPTEAGRKPHRVGLCVLIAEAA